MKNTEFYRQILGIVKPWSVLEVNLDVESQRVDIRVEHSTTKLWPCSGSNCKQRLSIYDHSKERCWRHLDTCQLQTFLHARIPRVKCEEHGIMQVSVPWAEDKSRFTHMMECFVIDVLQHCSTVSSASAITRLSWDQVSGIMSRAVARGLARKTSKNLTAIGVDEKAHRKGHKYLTVVCDHDTGTVEYVSENRRAESLESFYESLSKEQIDGIQIISMDMWAPYLLATRNHIPDANSKIVFDRFHIMKHVCEAVDKVRRQENQALGEEGISILKKTRFMWLYNEENLPEKYRERMTKLCKISWLKAARAWALKESLRAMWTYRSIGWARKYFAAWFSWATRSRLEPMRKVAWMIKKNLEQILNYCKHGVTNAVAEGLNSKIMTIKRKACGYRSVEAFKNAIYFYCGGLDLYPR